MTQISAGEMRPFAMNIDSLSRQARDDCQVNSKTDGVLFTHSILSQPGVDPARGSQYDPNLMHWGGMDPYFNRQRYGVNDTSFIMASTDSGASWALGEGAPGVTAHTGPHHFFAGRLASPRLINAGQGYRDAPDPAHVYAMFPGTTKDSAFFAQNDAIWLGRVPTARVLDRSAWQFFAGMSAGRPSWTPV
jgi:hypothetical protein